MRLFIRTTRNVIAVTGALALLVAPAALAAPAPTISSTTTQVAKVNSVNTWVDASTVYEGTSAQETVVINNPGSTTSATVSIVRADGKVIGTTSTTLQNGSNSVMVPLKTDGASWVSVGKAATGGVNAVVTLADGASTQSKINATFAPRPVVLLHGLWSDATTWKTYEGFLQSHNKAWHAYAVGDGKYPGVMNTGALLDPTGVPNTVDQNSDEAWEYINALRADLNANEIDVVGHSMGGITTRRVLHAQGKTAQDAIRDVVMLGTPNGGSYCATLWAVPATEALKPKVMQQFNKDNPGYPGTTSTLVYSEHLAPTCTDFSWGDSVVPRWSAKTVKVDRLDITEATLHSNMTKDLGIFNAFVLPTLARPSGVKEPASNASGSGTGQVLASSTVDPVEKQGKGAPGQAIDVAITVTTGSELYASVVTGQGAHFDLVLPGGKEIALTRKISGLPVYSAETAKAIGAEVVHLRGTSPKAFEWALTVDKRA